MKRVLIIAEAGVNHNGKLELAKKLIDAAKDAGADIVKFQTFKAENLVSRKAKMAEYQISNTKKTDTQYNMLKKLELSVGDHKKLIQHCKKRKIEFLSTAFDSDSLLLLESMGIRIFKIPSGEITNYPYLSRIGKTRKQVILSTGMATMKEIDDAIKVLLGSGTKLNQLTVLHCNTEYPTPMSDVNLLAMHSIKKKFKVKIGYSDHTKGIEVAIAAVALGAEVIEKHFTLDKNMEGPDHKASLNPDELKQMVNAIRNIERALGSSLKVPSASETKNIPVARKSIHIARDLKMGHQLIEADLVMKRPGDGISPMKMKQVIGKRIKINLKEDTKLRLKDLQ